MKANQLNEAKPSALPAMSLEHYAVTQAHIAHFGGQAPPSKVLERLGVTPCMWTEAKTHWMAAIESEFDDDASPLATEFGREFARTRARLEELAPELEAIEPLAPPPAVGRDFNPVEETALALGTLDEDALPFVAAALASRPPRASSPRPPSEAGATQEVSTLGPGILAALPFSRVAEADPDDMRLRLSITQYASLHAELAEAPTERERVLLRYGLTERTCAEVDAVWHERFASQPDDRRRFGELVANYRAWLRNGALNGS